MEKGPGQLSAVGRGSSFRGPRGRRRSALLLPAGGAGRRQAGSGPADEDEKARENWARSAQQRGSVCRIRREGVRQGQAAACDVEPLPVPASCCADGRCKAGRREAGAACPATKRRRCKVVLQG